MALGGESMQAHDSHLSEAQEAELGKSGVGTFPLGQWDILPG